MLNFMRNTLFFFVSFRIHIHSVCYTIKFSVLPQQNECALWFVLFHIHRTHNYYTHLWIILHGIRYLLCYKSWWMLKSRRLHDHASIRNKRIADKPNNHACNCEQARQKCGMSDSSNNKAQLNTCENQSHTKQAMMTLDKNAEGNRPTNRLFFSLFSFLLLHVLIFNNTH